MTLKGRTKICISCGLPYKEHPKFSEKQWSKSKLCGFKCLSKPLETRFWNKILKGETEDDCWKWLGAKGWAGYGQLGNQRKHGHSTASRVSWEIHNGPIPKGMCVLHKCDNRECCNPLHLWLGTQQENIQDMIDKGRQDISGLNYKRVCMNER